MAYPLPAGRWLAVRLTVATTRPETMLGDVAVMVHPEDERYMHLIGKEVVLPLCDRNIPVIADDYVDKEFGTGVVKVTPAHDTNDYAVGQRHKLPIIGVLTLDAAINDNAPEKYRGLDRFVARKAVVADLEAARLSGRSQKAQADGAALHPHRPGDRADADRPVVCRREQGVQSKTRPANPSRRKRLTRWTAARSSSCPSSGSTPTTSGWATSRTGAFRASSGGATRFRPGTTRTARSMSRTEAKPQAQAQAPGKDRSPR